VTDPILTMRGISKRFGAVHALTDVEFRVVPGEVVALVGDNGAGKSTLIKVISGVGPADAGELEFEGRHVSIHKPQDATSLGIATVYQDLALCDNLDVAGNLFLGQEKLLGGPGRAVRWMDHVAMEKRAWELMAQLSIAIPDVRSPVATLSGGQRQSVAIARSLLGNPKIVILDEPTAALGVAQTTQVLDLVRRLRDSGLGVIIISHNIANIFAVADRICVLRLGRNSGEFVKADTTPQEVVAAITGARHEDAHVHLADAHLPTSAGATGQPAGQGEVPA
jgi:D-xylose transport system ATP-binding protein